MFNFLKKAVMGGNAGEQASAAPQPATPYSETKIGRLRYQVEHVFFRDFFFKNGAGLIDALLEPHGMGNVYCTALQEMRAHPKYYDDEFGLESIKTASREWSRSDQRQKQRLLQLRRQGKLFRDRGRRRRWEKRRQKLDQ